jgi:hypothetical protein
MSRFSLLMCLGLLAGCGDGQPFFEVDPGDGDGDGDLGVGVELPPGTDDPSPNSSITRFEAKNDTGGGFVTDVSYNATNDTFTVDNIGFDGDNVYKRGVAVSSMNGYAVYEANVVATDPVSGDPIGQIRPYRALLGISENSVGNDEAPRTAFAIVRTGGYVNYGFGGFIYERNGSVVLPTSGQARFDGDYAGVRVFSGAGGLEYTRGDMTMAIDFDDFNTNRAIRGEIRNREAFDQDGVAIDVSGPDGLVLPTLVFDVQAGSATLTSDGEFSGTLRSVKDNGAGGTTLYEEGIYYGVIAGDLTDKNDGGEIVGIVVIESQDPRYSGVSAQETGGFILYR